MIRSARPQSQSQRETRRPPVHAGDRYSAECDREHDSGAARLGRQKLAEHPDRGHRRHAGRAGRRRQGAPHRPVRSRGQHDPLRARRPPDHRVALRVLPVDSRPRTGRAAGASRVGHRLRAVRAAGPTDSSPAPSARPISSTSPTGARQTRASPARTSSATCASPTRSSHRRRSRATPAQIALAWLLAEGDDIAPSPAPNGSPASGRRPPLTASN